jgi:glycosyltransferase involved in cell wall biosynthesis
MNDDAIPMISLLLPTRNRAESLCRMIDSAYALAARPDRLETIVGIDDDDVSTLAIDFAAWPGWTIRKVVGPRRPMAELNTACLDAATGQLLFAVNDDVVVRTPGWDDRLRAAVARFPDGVWLAFPNDLLQGDRLATFPCLSRVSVRLLGEPYPRAFRGEFIDVHLMDIFQRLKGAGHDRVLYLDDVVFEHLHHHAGKSANDATYRERLNILDDDVYLGLHRARGTTVRRLCRHIKAATQGRIDAGADAVPVLEPEPVSGWIAFVLRSLEMVLWSCAPAVWRLRVFSWLWRRRFRRFCGHKA